MKLRIPTSQNDITLRQYIEAQEKPEREQMAIYLNITPETLAELPQSVYDEALVCIVTALQEDQETHVKRFTINGVEYGFVPNLDQIESGAFAIAESSIQEVTTAAEFVNAMYRPIKRKAGVFYSVKPFAADRVTQMLDAPLSAYTSSVVFFYNLGNDLTSYIQSYTP